MDLDCALGGTEPGPGEKRQAEIHGGRIQDIEGLLEFQRPFFAGVELPGDSDQVIAKILEDSVIPGFDGIRQGGTGHETPETNVVELFPMGVQACFDVP